MALVSKITPEMRQAARLRLTTDMSVAEIAARMGVVDSTVYGWFDKMNLETTTTKVEEPTQAPVPEEPSEYTDPTMEELKTQFVNGIARAQKDVFFRVICALYWGEGRLGDMDDLESTSEVSIASSDANLINLWLKWLETSDFEQEKKLRVHLNFNSPESSDSVRNHWRKVLRTQSTIETEIDVVKVKSKTKKISKKQKYGSIYVTLYNYLLRALILGGISHLKTLSTK